MTLRKYYDALQQGHPFAIRVCTAVTFLVLPLLPALAQSGLPGSEPSGATSLSDQIVPLASQVALGAVVGYVVAVLLRKVGKFVAIAVVVAFAVLQVLASLGQVDLGPITGFFDGFLGTVGGELPSVMDGISANIPAVIGGVLGFLVGVRGKQKKRKKED